MGSISSTTRSRSTSRDEIVRHPRYPANLRSLKDTLLFQKLSPMPNEETSQSPREKKNAAKSTKISQRILADQNEPAEELCSINDSPKRLFQLARNGRAQELELILNQKPERITLKDSEGNTLLHIAALYGKSSLCDLLVYRGCEVNAQNAEGNAPLHLAAMKDEPKTVAALLALKAGNCIRNDQQETPLHVAVRNNSSLALDHLLQACKGNVDKPGANGITPLHLASILDYVEIAKMLIAYGADVLQNCYSGRKPVHAAAAGGSTKVLRYLLSESAFPTSAFLTAVDEEKKTALHCAVTNANLECVKFLLEHGADLGAQMYDLSTPLHLACTQGYLAIVIQLYESVPDKFAEVLYQKDTQGMTPLHRATMFDHLTTVEFLLNKSADMEETDKEGKTPLVLAASRGSWGAVKLLLQFGADPSAIDLKQKNFLHYYILSDAPDLSEYMQTLIAKHPKLLDQRDHYGCAPLHYAAKLGLIKSSDGLVRLGASIDVKSKCNQSALHFAAKYGRYNTVKRLLEKGINIINESDNEGNTSLHLAAENGHTNVVQLLMSKGALIQRNYAGKTPLHLAALNNQRETAAAIVTHYGHLVNCADKDGNTALHLAAAANASKTVTYLLGTSKLTTNDVGLTAVDWAIQKKNREACLAMVESDRWQELLTMSSKLYGWPVLGLIEHLPEVMMVALDRSVSRANCHPMSPEYFVRYDFELLEPTCLPEIMKRSGPDAGHQQPLKALNHMVLHGRTELLSHPVCGNYLNKKWTTYGIWIYGFNVALYVAFLALLTFLIVAGVQHSLIPKLKMTSFMNVQKHYHLHHRPDRGAFDMNDTRTSDWMLPPTSSGVYNTVAVFVAIFTIVNMIKEVIQIYHQRTAYFMEGTNYLEWFLYISATIFAVGGYGDTENHMNWRARWQLGAMAIFAAWLNFMLYLQRFGLMGIYVVMFLGILKTLLRALFVFMFLIVAFALAFHVLIPLLVYPDVQDFFEKPDILIDISMLRTPHGTFWTSFLRVAGMMLGDFDSINNYIYPLTEGTLPFPETTSLFVVAFVVTMSILLMNLLIGLAVGDIEKVLRSATLRRLGMQVELHTALEDKLPVFILKRITVREAKYFPNKCGTLSRKLCDVYQNQDSETSYVEDSVNTTKNLQMELSKQRKKIKDVKQKLDQQYELLRLIVAKMEIKDEADQLDEGSTRVVCGQGKDKNWISNTALAKVRSAAWFENFHKEASNK